MSKDKQQKNKSNTGTASAVLQFHDRPLAYKLSVAVALLLVICMSLMILISAVIAGRSLNKTVSGEFNGIATENALIVFILKYKQTFLRLSEQILYFQTFYGTAC